MNYDSFEDYYNKNPQPNEFESKPVYFRDGDYLTHFFSDEPYTAQRIDSLLTIYKSNSGDIVGCKIKGVKQLVRNVVSLVGVESVDFNWLFVAGVGVKQIQGVYFELTKKVKGITVDSSNILETA